MIQFDEHIFQVGGWNHQLDQFQCIFLFKLGLLAPKMMQFSSEKPLAKTMAHKVRWAHSSYK